MPDKIVHKIHLDRYAPMPAQIQLGTVESYGVEQIAVVAGAGWDGLDIVAVYHPPKAAEPVRVLVPSDGLSDVPPEATASAGRGALVIAGMADGVQIASCNIAYTVIAQAGTDGTTSDAPTPDLVQQILSAAHGAVKTAEGVRADMDKVLEAESGRETAEANRAAAESERVTAETARKDAESKRASAEQERQTAEEGRVEAESSRVKAEAEREKQLPAIQAAVDELKEDIVEVDSKLSESINEIWESPLASKKANAESIGLVVGSYPSANGTFKPDIKYNASVVLQLNAGDIIGFTEAGYSVKFGKRTDTSFSPWMTSIKINESGEYTVVVRKDNSYTDLTSQIDAINKIFGIITTTNELNIPSNYVLGSMINYESIVDSVIDVVRDRGIDNTGAVDVTDKIQECLDISKKLGRVTLFFRTGTYKVSKALDYCNDTELIFAKNAVLSCVHKDGTVLTDIKSISNGSNYDRGSLTIKGGIIKRNYTELDSGEQRSIGIQCCQLKFLSIIGTEFIDICAGNHLIDMSGIGSVVIDNCIFRGMHLPEVIRPTKEANYSYTKDDGTVMYTDLEMLQIDHGKGLSTPSLEENPTNNVIIRNCIFRPNKGNPHSVIYRPIGMHSVSSIASYENIEIYNNQFEQSLGRVISISNAVNIKINNNRFINTTNPMFSAIIRFTLMIFEKYYNCKNIEIIGNTVLYKTETNGNHFLSADLSNGTVKAINGIVKWNDIGLLDIDTNNLVNFEIPSLN